jgi:hypothetical protein
MASRIIEKHPSELANLGGRNLIESLRQSGGRAIAAEILPFKPPLIEGINNGALAASSGADIIHLNHYDTKKPFIAGFSSTQQGIDTWKKMGVSIVPTHEVEGPIFKFLSNLGLGVTIRDLSVSIGRTVGVGLEVNFDDADAPKGRLATPESVRCAFEQGAAYIALVGTPAHSPEVLARNIQILRSALGSEPVFIAGRMPWGGSRFGCPDFLYSQEIEGLISAGADIIMLPTPGTMPGATMEVITEAVETAHHLGALAEVTIGTSQESADEDTVRRLALDGKLTGADLYQIGDGGYGGMAMPENILAFSIAIKGKPHTYRRIATFA